MMADLAEMKAALAELIALRARGVRSVQAGEMRVEYRTDAEVAAAIADLERRIAVAEKPRPMVARSSFTRG